MANILSVVHLDFEIYLDIAIWAIIFKVLSPIPNLPRFNFAIIKENLCLSNQFIHTSFSPGHLKM